MTDGLLPDAVQSATGRPTPDPRTAYRHFRSISTRWMDNDIYGHVNNVVYYSYFDTAVNLYLMEQGAIDIERGPVIGLVVETHCNYFRSIAFPDAVQVGLRVARLGASSVRYEVGMFRNDDELASAQGHFVHVYVDRANRRPVVLPDELRTALNALRAG
jgi:acyl-CoA thioester hydrolase